MDGTVAWVLSSSENGSATGGNTTLSIPFTPTNKIGMMVPNKTYPVGTSLESIIMDMGTTYVLPKGTFSFSNNDSFIERGTTFNLTVTVTGITKGTNPVSKITFLDGSTEVNSQKYATSTSTYSYTINSISNDKKITARIVDSTGQFIESYKQYKFVYPSYIGIVNTFDVTDNDIIALTKLLSDKKDYTFDNIAMVNKRVCFAYPKSYGNLASVKDGNNFEILNSFTKKELTINGVDYVVYVSTNTASLNNGKMIFK